MKRAGDSDRPLLVAAAEADAEISARCRTAERACAAIGLTPGSCAERLLVLVAKVAGNDVYSRTAADIAADRDLPTDTAPKSVRRVIRQLRSLRLLFATEAPVPQWHCVGKPPKLWMLRVNWPVVRDLVAKDTAWRQQLAAGIIPAQALASDPDETMQTDLTPQKPDPQATPEPRGELGTLQGHARSTAGTTEVQGRDIAGTSQGHLPDHSLFYPYTHNPGPQSQGMPRQSTVPRPANEPPKPPPLPADGQADHRNLGLPDQPPPGTSLQAQRPAPTRLPAVTPDQIAGTAGRLFASLRYDGDDGQTLWYVAAAFDAGLIPEAAIGDAVQGTRSCATRSPVGYFRTVLAERLGLDAAGLRALLARVAIRGPVPTSRPPRVAAATQAPNRPPRAVVRNLDREANEARNAMLAVLEIG